MRLLRKRITAGVLAAIMVVSSLQFSTYTVDAKEIEGVVEETAVESADVAEEAKNDDASEDINESVDEAIDETVDEAIDETVGEDLGEGGFDGDLTEDSLKVDDSAVVTGSEESGEEVVDEEALDKATEALETISEIEQQLESAEASLDGIYQFGGAPSGPDADVNFSIESDGSVYAVNEVDGITIDEYLYNKILERKENIDVSAYKIEFDRTIVSNIVNGVINDHPDLYFAKPGTFYGMSEIVTQIDITYDNDLDDAAFKRETKTALSNIKDGMNDLQKAVVLHDYLAINCEYDYDNYLAGTLPQTSYSAYGVLVNRTAVCQGYALAYKYLLNQVGITCYMVNSELMNHAWNLIELDGNYYQVDVTWDDPARDLIGRSCHAYMFCSDADFGIDDDNKNAHRDWSVTSGSDIVDYTAVDTRYDNAFWKTVNAPLVLAGDDWNDCYYIYYDAAKMIGKVNKTSLSSITNKGDSIFDIGKWTVWGNSNSVWQNAYSGLFKYNNRLYYNDKTSICSIDLDGSDKRVKFEPDTTNGYIYGSALCQGKVYYSLRQTPNVNAKETVRIADIDIEAEEPPVIPVERIELNVSELTLKKGETAELEVTIYPENATDTDITWNSSDDSVATVEDGLVTAAAEGDCTVTASIGDKKAVCSVNVAADEDNDVIDQGEYKENGSDITWVIDKNGKLTVEGTGEFSGKIGYYSRAPWYNQREKIKSAEVNVSGMVNASFMFRDCINLVSADLDGFDTSQVTDMDCMFQGCKSLTNLDIRNFNTSMVTNMYGMFQQCSSLTDIDISSFDTHSVTDMTNLFSGCAKLANIKLDVDKFDTSQVTSMAGMFDFCSSLESIDVSHFKTSKVTGMSTMFRYCSSLTSIDVSGFDTSSVTDMSDMFVACQNLTDLDLSGFKTAKVTNMSAMFMWCTELTSLSVEGFDTRQVTNMSCMFGSCYKLVNLDVSNFNTSQVTNMGAMFADCSSLTNLTVSGFDTAKVTNMADMFYGCESLTSLDISKFITDNVTNMNAMFHECAALTSLEVSNFNTLNVTDMSYMFAGCSGLTSLDLKDFKTSNVTNMSYMFGRTLTKDGCSFDTIDLSNFDTSNVTDMSGMFNGCTQLTTFELHNFDTRKVTDMSTMFQGCEKLVSLDMSTFDTSNVTSMRKMFLNCISLENLDMSNFNAVNVTDMNNIFFYSYKLKEIRTPYNLTISAELPLFIGEVWRKADGTQVTELPQNLSSSIVITRGDATVAEEPYITVTKVRTEYKCGDTINLDDLTVIYYDEEGYPTILTASSYDTNVSELDTSTAGTMKLVITYNNLTDEVELTVTQTAQDDKEPYITVTKVRTEYKCGDTINLDDLTVTYYDEEGTAKELTAFEYSTNALDLDMSTAETKQLVITYNGLTAEVELTVTQTVQDDKEPYITVTKTKTKYACGDTINLDDLTVTYYDEEGTAKELTASEYTTNASGLNMSTAGTKKLVITYNGLTAEIELTVTQTAQDNKEPYITVTKTKKEYKCGDTINLDDLTVIYYDEEGVSRVLTASEYTTNASGLDMSIAGTKKLVITYKSLTKEIELTVTKPEQNNKEGLKVKLKYPGETYIYTGSAIEPKVVVTNNGETLIEGVDYTVKYSNNINASESAKIIITGKGDLSGSKTQEFKINPKWLDNKDSVNVGSSGSVASSAEAELKVEGDYVTVAEDAKISPILIYGGMKLGTKDFKLADEYKSYKWKLEDNNKVITVTGQGNFTGERRLTVRVISKTEQAKNKIIVNLSKDAKDIVYNGQKREIGNLITVSTKDMQSGLIKGADYIISYPSDIISAGVKKFTVVGISDRCMGSVTKSYTIKPKKAEFTAEYDKNKSYAFISTGTTITDLTVKDNGTKLEPGVDYKVSYSGNKKVGTAKFTVTGIGNYKGSKCSGSFTINAGILNNNEKSPAGITDGLQIVIGDKVFKNPGIYKSSPYVSINGVQLKASNYTVEYYLDNPMTNSNAKVMDKNNKVTNENGDTTVWVKITGKANGNYATSDNTCYAVASYKVRSLAPSNSYDLSKAKVTFMDKEGKATKKVDFTGNPITGTDVQIVVTYKADGNTVPLYEGKDYKVEFVNNVKKGKATVVITGMDNQNRYVGSKTANFSIVANNVKNIAKWFN